MATDSRVTYGVSQGHLTSQVDKTTLTTEHEVQLTGLTPDTKYYYAIGSTDATLAGGDAEHFFVTAPKPGTEKPVRVWVIGDSGTANKKARTVRNAYFGFNGTAYTDVWLMLGDNAYSDGTDTEYQDAVFDIYPSLLRQTVLWPTLGNHDGHRADSDTQTGAYYDIFTLPRRGEAGGLASGTEAYYSFDYANIHFICLDSYDSDRSPGGAMLTWLQKDLAATTQKWIIAYWHHPPYSKGSHDSDRERRLIEMRENVLPILESYGVDLVLSGHGHSYERSFLLHGHYGTSDTLTKDMLLDNGDGRRAGDGPYMKGSQGTVYVVAGSSGRTGGGTLDHPVMHVSLNQLGSLVLHIDGDQLDATFIDDAGDVKDSFTIVKANQRPVADAGRATFPPAADTFVNSRNPTKNFGSAAALEVDGSPTKITYLRFTVTGLRGTVQSARLRLQVVNASNFGGTIYSSENGWDETEVTFENRPGIDGPALDTLGRVVVGDIVELDVTAAIAGNGTYSFAMDSNGTNGADYRSREAGTNPPTLIVTTN